MVDVRETLARIIDPSSWRVMDCYLEAVKRRPNCGYDPESFVDAASLTKADAILAFLSLLSPASDAAKDIPDDVRQLVIAARAAAFGRDDPQKASEKLYGATKAFANRVPWEGEAASMIKP